MYPGQSVTDQDTSLANGLGVQGIGEKRNLPSGGELTGHLEGVFCTYCVSCAQIDPPGGSELTPRGQVTLFFNTLHSKGAPGNSPVWATFAQNGQKVLKKGAPSFLAVFSVRSRAARPCCRRFSKKKKWGISPRWTRKNRTFFRDSARG